MNLKPYALEAIRTINSGKVKNKRELNNLKIELCKRFSLAEMPTDPDILAFAKHRTKKLASLLGVKPVRSLSGVSVVAVMAKPHKCPGECIYCPSGLGVETPKSYTGKEPATMRALMFNFDPYAQARNRIEQLNVAGHSTEKIELIVMGGTFPSMSPAYQSWFVKRCLDACNCRKSRTLAEAKRKAESAPNRVIGTTFETRPDFCAEKHINRMLNLGGTRVELGVQTLSDAIYKRIKRNHSVKDVADATARLKDSAFKVCYHMMPGLPGSSKRQDIETFKLAFDDERFKPDMLKIYPCTVIEGTELYKEWKRGVYKPLATEPAAEIVAEIKSFVPRWCRIMRVQRDTPTTVISAGLDKGNLRQIAQQKLMEKGKKCSCIRCREAGLKIYKENAKLNFKKIKINEISYVASSGTEIFISADEPKHDALLGFCRLRIPAEPFRSEITPRSALVRELRVFGTALALGERPEAKGAAACKIPAAAQSPGTALHNLELNAPSVHLNQRFKLQHRSLGRQLLQRAENIASEDFGCNKAVVISGLGVREYYRSLGYKNDGAYVSKKIK